MTEKLPERSAELAGYANRLSVAPGETLAFMLSTTHENLETAFVRLRHGDTNSRGPGFREHVVEGWPGDVIPGRTQTAKAGSCLVVPNRPPLLLDGGFTVLTWVLPTLPTADHPQGIVSWGVDDGSAGFSLSVDEDGLPTLILATDTGPHRLVADQPLVEHEWYAVAARYDATSHGAVLDVSPRQPWPPLRWQRTAQTLPRPAVLDPPGPLLVGAAEFQPGGDSGRAGTGHFNGKIASPLLYDAALPDEDIETFLADVDQRSFPPALSRDPELALDLAAAAGRRTAPDVSGNGRDAELFNLPMAAVTGPNWDGTEVDFRGRPEHYRAAHFHDDDLEDAGWEPDMTLEVPPDARSGVYALRTRSADDEDHIPFVVRPPRDSATADILFLMPTLTYLAYANERILFGGKVVEDLVVDTEPAPDPDPADLYLAKHPELGLSVYDVHSDGTGNCYSSYLRPIPNMRPRYRFWSTGGPERFSADLYVIDWLDEERLPYDVATDHDLHEDGADLLGRYRAVITGAHPEYWTARMLDSLESYLNAGGRLMYLGGNGFYWVTSIDPERPHAIEVRRGVNGTRAWTSAPGEAYQASTGEPSGLWRYRGRPPNRLVGVGFSAQSDSHTPAAGYARTPDSYEQDVAWIFEGVEGEIVGEFGLINGGAAGYEIDRCAADGGSPAHTRILATSKGRHNDTYLFVVEDLLFSQHGLGGEQHPEVRADMTLLHYPNGGAVFSAGSCNWSGSLSWNGYDNSISAITRNVLNRFASGKDVGDT